MKLSKSLGLVAIFGMLMPAPLALASHGNGNGGKPPVEKPPQVDKDKKDTNPVRSVPEPATIALLGAAAGAAFAGKRWQKRRASKSRIAS